MTPSLTVSKTESHPEGDFQVLSPPDVHAGVVLAELVKVLPVHSEQPACHGGGPEGEQSKGGGVRGQTKTVPRGC